jgi:hypothetical protein
MKKLFLLELVFLVFVMVVISSFIYTRVMAQENKLTAQEITISDIVIKEDYEALEVDITIPVIQGLEDKQVEEKINQTIQEDILNFKYRIQTESEEYLQSAKKEGEEIRKYKYIASTYYIVHYQKDNILSLSVFYYCYTLGAHGCTVQEAYNLNLTNGERISLSDILKEKKDYVEVINQEIKRQIQLNPEDFFEDGAVFQSINPNQSFYLVEDGVVIYFGLYEIAPYSSGIRYFKIPFSLFEAY